jgi:hypothetical protein
MTEENGKPCRGNGADTTRRTLLQAAVGGAGAVALLGLGVRGAHAAKVAQSAVNYSLEPNGTHICKNCNFFIAPNSCKQVDGVINPNGHCKIGVWKD